MKLRMGSTRQWWEMGVLNLSKREQKLRFRQMAGKNRGMRPAKLKVGRWNQRRNRPMKETISHLLKAGLPLRQALLKARRSTSRDLQARGALKN